MTISVRPRPYSLPSYSLTGDLLGFLRCGLQYRYTRIGKLPPSHPVQLWFGEFIHGVLEEAFRRYKASAALPPFPGALIDEIRALIKARLASRGLYPWSPDLEQLGDARAEAAIQELGPHLFPLIHRAEVRLTGARLLPPIQSHLQFREADRYEMVGVIDVVTHLELADPKLRGNAMVQQLLAGLGGGLPTTFEVIVDYKGMRRPPIPQSGSHGGLWDQYGWQVQTYGELRRVQSDALPVVAGVLLYVNELYPTRGDLIALKQEIAKGETDVSPAPGSQAETLLKAWKPSNPHLPTLPFEFRLARALRIVPITSATIALALQSFDKVVEEIETCRGREFHGISVRQAWTKNAHDEGTCVVCDSRTFCPEYQQLYARKHGETEPRLPAVKV